MLVGGLVGAGVGGRGGRRAGAALLAAARSGPGPDDAGRRPALRQHLLQCVSITGGAQGLSLKAKWLGTGAFFNFNGHALFVLCMVVLTACVLVVLLVRKGTVGRNLAAMRGSEMAAAGLGVNITWQRIVVFALAGAIAGVGGVVVTIQQQVASPTAWNYNYSLDLHRVGGDDGSGHRRRGDSGRDRFLRGHADPHLPAVPTRREQPGHRPLRLRGVAVRQAPRGRARVPEAAFDPLARASAVQPGRRRSRRAPLDVACADG